MLEALQSVFRSVLKLVSGKQLGRRFPILWRVYDLAFRIAAPKQPFYHYLGGMPFLVIPNEPLLHVRKWMQQYMLHDEYEPETTKLVRELVQPGETAVDIGASIGYFSMLLSKCVGETGRVYSFEPTREGFKYLCENRLINSAHNLTPWNLAAWDKEEPVRMPKSSFAINAQWANGVAVSDFLAERGVKSVDFIKMDIDGAEPWAMRGLEALIENSPNLKMVCEYYPKYIEASDGKPEEFLEMLNKYFDLQVIEGDYGDGYWNYLCTRKENS